MAFLQAWMRFLSLPLTKPPILRLCRKYFNGGNKSEDFLFNPDDTLERPTDDLPHPGGCCFVCIHHMNVFESPVCAACDIVALCTCFMLRMRTHQCPPPANPCMAAQLGAPNFMCRK